MGPIRVLLADDHALVRAGLCALLRGFAGIEVVAEAADGAQAVALAGSCMPDVAVLDVNMPVLSGLEAARLIRERHPELRVLMLSMHIAEMYLQEALRLGARGYVLKDAAPEELERAVREVHAGGLFLSPAVVRKGGELEALTARQREILTLIALGHSTRSIAERLSISIKTVETHRTQLMQRLGIFDVAGLTRLALRSGLIPPG